jgi:putative Mg2+ transporter-C (MgtC) family protein
MRTNSLVALGAAMFVSISLMVTPDASPTRIAAQVVSGIGFIGAGLIIREGLNVQGLNSAATLWCSGAIGSLCGAGFIAEAAIGTLAVLLAHIAIRPIGMMLDARRKSLAAKGALGRETNYTVRLVCRETDEQHMRSLLLHSVGQNGLALRSLISEDAESRDRIEIRADLAVENRDDKKLEDIIGRLSLEPGVSSISWSIQEDIE